MNKDFLVVNKGSGEVYGYDTLQEVAEVVRNERPVDEVRSEIHWALKRTGRWDREDGVVVVITSTPEE